LDYFDNLVGWERRNMTRIDRSSASIAGHRAIKANEPQPRVFEDVNKNHLKSMIKEAMDAAKVQKRRGCWL